MLLKSFFGRNIADTLKQISIICFKLLKQIKEPIFLIIISEEQTSYSSFKQICVNLDKNVVTSCFIWQILDVVKELCKNNEVLKDSDKDEEHFRGKEDILQKFQISWKPILEL